MVAKAGGRPPEDEGDRPDEAAAEPQILRFTTGSAAPRKRVPLFYIDDTEYTVDATPSPSRGLKYLHLLRTQGPDVATSYMLETLLGEEGYKALMEYDDLTSEQMSAVVDRANAIMLGSVEGPKGSPKKRRPRSRG